MEILRVFWQRGEVTVRDVTDEITKHKKVAYTSIATLMRIMVDKGLIRLSDERRPQRFVASLSEESTCVSIVNDLKQRVFGGSIRDLVRHALGGKKTSPQEIAEIKSLLKEMD